jgi:hypothetical protein
MSAARETVAQAMMAATGRASVGVAEMTRPGNSGSSGTAGGGRRGHRMGHKAVSVAAPDLAMAAGEAVVGFLQGASTVAAGYPAQSRVSIAARAATAAAGGHARTQDPGGGVTATDGGPASGTAARGTPDVASMAWRAAAANTATLDRVEAAVARLEADISSSLRAQTELQVGAGAAAEAAVRAAQAAWIAANTPARAQSGAKTMARRAEHVVVFVFVVLIVTVIELMVTAIPAH